MNEPKDLKYLEQLINNELNVINDDVPAKIDPHAHEIRMLSKLSLDIIDLKWDEMTRLGRLDKLKRSNKAFRALFDSVKANLNQAHRWTFWHYFGLCMVTSIAYAHCLDNGYHKTVSLREDKNWNERRVEVAVLALHYFAGTLFPNAIGDFNRIIEQHSFDMNAIAKHIQYRLSKFT